MIGVSRKFEGLRCLEIEFQIVDGILKFEGKVGVPPANEIRQ